MARKKKADKAAGGAYAAKKGLPKLLKLGIFASIGAAVVKIAKRR